MSRDRCIAMDFVSGTPAIVIAERESISLPRVYQIIEKVCKSVGLATKTATKEELGLLLVRRQVFYWHYPPEGSPEYFYWHELKGE